MPINMALKNNTGRVIIWLCVFGIALLLFMYLRCGKGKTQPSISSSKVDTVFIDTGRVISKTDTHYVPKPYRISVKDTFPFYESVYPDQPLDSNQLTELYNGYYGLSYYRDTVLNEGGNVVEVMDTLSQNKIIGRGVLSELSMQTITKTVTITETQQRRVTGYVGGKLGGNKIHPLQMGSVTGGFMDKKGWYYGGAYTIILNQRPVYEFQMMFPIRLKK